MSVAVLAGLWGLAEATLFFIVPDVVVTWVAVRDRRSALVGCAWATVGALVGGLVMYWWGGTDGATAVAALDAVPAISGSMIEGVRASLEDRGLLALFLGPLTGTPYKIYAVQSGALGSNLPAFVLVSIPARAIRFVLLTLVAAGIAHGPAKAWPLFRKRLVVGSLWALFYTAYFVALWD